jgi:hypothetical protein
MENETLVNVSLNKTKKKKQFRSFTFEMGELSTLWTYKKINETLANVFVK